MDKWRYVCMHLCMYVLLVVLFFPLGIGLAMVGTQLRIALEEVA